MRRSEQVNKHWRHGTTVAVASNDYRVSVCVLCRAIFVSSQLATFILCMHRSETVSTHNTHHTTRAHIYFQLEQYRMLCVRVVLSLSLSLLFSPSFSLFCACVSIVYCPSYIRIFDRRQRFCRRRRCCCDFICWLVVDNIYSYSFARKVLVSLQHI